MKYWKKYPLVITVLGMLIAAMLYYSICFVSHTRKYKPKVGDIVILGDEPGSMRLAKPEDVDEKDIKIGMVISNGDSVCFTVLGRVTGINTVDIEYE